jgi:guanylate kinase
MGNRETARAIAHPERVFVLSGPSGVGKNAIAARLCERGAAVRALTATSRPPRPGERDGVDYYFLSENEFQEWLRDGRLLEHIRYCGHSYGTPAFSINRAAEGGRPVLLVVDVDGALRIKSDWPDVRLVFVAPHSLGELRQRLGARGEADEAGIRQRLARAREEMALADRYDCVVVNKQLEDAVEQVVRIIERAGRLESPCSGPRRRPESPA